MRFVCQVDGADGKRFIEATGPGVKSWSVNDVSENPCAGVRENRPATADECHQLLAHVARQWEEREKRFQEQYDRGMFDRDEFMVKLSRWVRTGRPFPDTSNLHR